MNPNKYEIEQKLEMKGLHPDWALYTHNNTLVVVRSLPGYRSDLPEAYGVMLSDGSEHPVHPRFLRPFPPVLPNGRGDIDEASTWEEFEVATGIPAAKIING